jgi:hypothetical protein
VIPLSIRLQQNGKLSQDATNAIASQKNFGRYATRIGKEREKGSDGFNELYFPRTIARAILFRSTEHLVKDQP